MRMTGHVGDAFGREQSAKHAAGQCPVEDAGQLTGSDRQWVGLAAISQGDLMCALGAKAMRSAILHCSSQHSRTSAEQ